MLCSPDAASGRARRWRLPLAIIFVLALLAPSTAGLAAFGPAAPFLHLGDGADPALAFDASGQAHVVWLAPARQRLIEATIGAAGQIATRELPLTVIFQPVDRGQVAAAIGGTTLHVAYAGGGQVCYLHRAVTETRWSAPECLPVGETGAVSRVNLAALPTGEIGLAWQEGQRVVVALRSNEGTYRVLGSPSVEARPARWPRLAAAGQRLTLVWEQERAPGPGNSTRSDVVAAEWHDTGWSQPISVSGFDTSASQWQARWPAVATDEQGQLHIAYTVFAPERGLRQALLYRVGALNTLAPAETVVAEAETPSIAVRGERVEIAWSAPVGSVLGGITVKNQEILWTARVGVWRPDRLVSHSAGPSYAPALAMTPDEGSAAVWWDTAHPLESGPILFGRREAGGVWPAPARPDIGALNRLTARADAPVAAGQVARSWLWGPRRWVAEIEPYADAPQATRTVAYYDKARIEVTDPNLDPREAGYFTNGLLVTEMTSGRLQAGDQIFLTREPARIPVAGDPISAMTPTYASFQRLVFIPEIGQAGKSSDRVGQTVRDCLNLAGAITACPGPEAVTLAQYVSATGRNIAAPFWEYMRQRGTVNTGDGLAEDLVFVWETTMGYPISEPVWITAVVDGQERAVLTQLFQRRVLTYTPGNPAGFEVEMGNVGQHYYLWRYGSMVWQDQP